MKQRKLNRFLCVLLSAALLSTGIEFPVSAAAEEEPLPAFQIEESVSEIQAAEETLGSSSDDDRSEAPENEVTADPVSADPADSGTENTQNTAKNETAPEENTFSDCQVVVNPIYEDVLDRTQLQAELDALQDGGQIQAKGTTRAAALYQSIEAAAEYVRGELVKRSTSFSFSVPSDLYTASQNFREEVFDAAMAYTPDCTGQEGDALLYGLQAYQVQSTSTGGPYTLNCTVLYHSDAAQETELTTKVNSVMAELALSGKSNYEKIRLIHDYICDHVEYDYTYSSYSAYDALCKGSSVCQGYAVLFYRMCKDAGLSVRIISGKGNGEAHGWNIVQIGSKYYNIDCTWDDQSTRTIYDYFLKNDAEFVNHVRDELYTSAAFLSEYPMASASYKEGQDEEEGASGLGLDNPEYDFISIEDKEVLSAAQGKPKILIFYKTTCGLSQASIRSIAQRGFPNVDILAIETTGQSKDSVISFKNTYASGNNDILFTYDTYGVADSRAMWAYFDAAGNDPTAGATLPIICYIDANNKFQYLTTGSTDGDAVASNLTRYCNYGVTGETYTITYVLDGGTNDSSNPATYTQTSPVIILKDPAKTGYTFAGWYSDAAFSHKVTQIGGGTTGNLTLYAKWEQSTDGLNINNPEISFTTIDDKTVTSKADQKPKLLIFFRTTCGYSRRTIKGIADHGFSDLDIYALEIDGRDKADVASFKDMYGSAQITFAYDTSGRYNTVLFQYLQVSGIYTSGSISLTLPVICYIDADNKLQYISQGYQSADDISARLEQYCQQKKPENPETSACRVTFDLQGHGTLPADYQNGLSVKKDSLIQEPTAPKADGYTFTGWYKEKDCKNKWNFSKDTVQTDTILYAGWQIFKEDSGDVPAEDLPQDGKIPEGFWTTPVQDVSYTGKAIKPEVHVYWNNERLDEGVDYTVKYKNNTKVNTISNTDGAPAIIITGKKHYPVGKTVYFNITPVDLEEVTADNIAVIYNQKVQKKIPVLSWNGKKLTNNKDFTVSYPDGEDAYQEEGDYDILVTAKKGSNFTGERTIQLSIINPDDYKLISKARVRKIPAQDYTGGPVELDSDELKVTFKGEEGALLDGEDYDVEYENNTEVGTATVILRGKGEYIGTKRTTFQIKGKSMKKASITGLTLQKSMLYNGSCQEQDTSKMEITVGTDQLLKGTDYEVFYSNNKNTGKAILIIQGINGYTGLLKKSFKITAYDLKEDPKNLIQGLETEMQGKLVSGKAKPKPQLTFGGKRLVEGRDYTISYKNNNRVKSAADPKPPTIIIKGKGNFKGTITKPFTITE